jgi:spore coat polysaccharide biosynthesis protein SpsF
MAITAAIVQARLGSERHPNKVLLTLPNGRSVMEEVLLRCCKIPGVDVVVAALPDTAENDILHKHVHRALCRLNWPRSCPAISVVRGPENDVLARYAKAAATLRADVVLRVTSDCPLIDPEVCGRVLATVNRFDGHRWVFAANDEPRTFPKGYDCEVFTRALLDAADKQATDAVDREHVGPWPRRNATDRHFIFAEGEDRSHLQWSLDTKEDFWRICEVFEQQMREAA